MRKIFATAVCLAAVIVFSACSENKETASVPAVQEEQVVQAPAEQEDLFSEEALADETAPAEGEAEPVEQEGAETDALEASEEPVVEEVK